MVSEHPLSKQIRRSILTQSKRANVGHIGSALSVVDLLAALYGGVLEARSATDPERDRFVLSKGHAAIALYSTLHATGRLSDSALASFCVDGSAIATHPEHVISWVDFSTGSLGLGLSFAVGVALAARIQESQRRAFVLLSDAECNEGSVWEAVMMAAHHKLGNVIAMVDVNGQQALGYTREVLDLAPLARRWEAFGWDAREVDGHDVDALTRTLESVSTNTAKPHVLLAQTTFGKGVSYMENTIAWHYLPMSNEQYAQAIGELEEQPEWSAAFSAARAPAAGSPTPAGRSLTPPGRGPTPAGRNPAPPGRGPTPAGRNPAPPGRSPTPAGRNPAPPGRSPTPAGRNP